MISSSTNSKSTSHHRKSIKLDEWPAKVSEDIKKICERVRKNIGQLDSLVFDEEGVLTYESLKQVIMLTAIYCHPTIVSSLVQLSHHRREARRKRDMRLYNKLCMVTIE